MRWYCFAIMLFGFVFSMAAQTAPASIPLDENAFFDDVPSNYVLKDRPLPWYLTLVQTPGTHVLIACCDTWDWFKGRIALMRAMVRRYVACFYARVICGHRVHANNMQVMHGGS